MSARRISLQACVFLPNHWTACKQALFFWQMQARANCFCFHLKKFVCLQAESLEFCLLLNIVLVMLASTGKINPNCRRPPASTGKINSNCRLPPCKHRQNQSRLWVPCKHGSYKRHIQAVAVSADGSSSEKIDLLASKPYFSCQMQARANCFCFHLKKFVCLQAESLEFCLLLNIVLVMLASTGKINPNCRLPPASTGKINPNCRPPPASTGKIDPNCGRLNPINVLISLRALICPTPGALLIPCAPRIFGGPEPRRLDIP